MEMVGIGDASWASNFIGIPYEVGGRSIEGLDCYGLVCLVYHTILGITLPDWVTQTEVDFEGTQGELLDIEVPENFCLVITPRNGGLPDHFGVYFAGGVLSVSGPSSCYVPVDRYMVMNPEAKFKVFQLPDWSVN
jgi:hypothetical protein